MLCPTVWVGYCQGESSSLRPGMCCVRQLGSGTVKVDPLAYVQVCVVSDSWGRVLSRGGEVLLRRRYQRAKGGSYHVKHFTDRFLLRHWRSIYFPGDTAETMRMRMLRAGKPHF